MGRWATTAAMLACAGTAAAQIGPSPGMPHIIVNPTWLERPTPASIQRYYPDRAVRLRVDGRVVLDCAVTAEGTVERCAVRQEDPAGYEFGTASIRLAQTFRFRPRTVDGIAVGGARINIPVAWRLAGGGRPAPAPASAREYEFVQPARSWSFDTPPIAAREAIEAAATAAPRGVRGVFALRVTATGRQEGRVFLNSEADYRDQRNLTVAIHPIALRGLEAAYRGEPDDFLVGKRVLVSGQAHRVRIDFLVGGQPTGKYYYQTHVDVFDPAQIRLVEDDALSR